MTDLDKMVSIVSQEVHGHTANDGCTCGRVILSALKSVQRETAERCLALAGHPSDAEASATSLIRKEFGL